ncbi:MAG: Flp pilus assembly protein CpaB [Proteobacteria bacterium]|nr:Flp pilus assembly protein CpaB [Pseudomonadota bacterium]
MSKMRIVMFGLAIGSAAVAGVLAKGVIGKKPKVETQLVTKVETTDVLVAGADVQIGGKLSTAALSWKAWPKENIQDIMITRDEMPDAEQQLAEARAAVPIFNGETIMEKKIVKPGAGGFMSAILPKGMRAISLAISSRASAGGFILPNDKVDIILTRKIPGPGQLVKSETVISNVRVLAINQVLRKVQEGDDVAMKEVETATFELEPQQAEVLAKVETEGELSLTLRSIAENDGKTADDGPQLAEKYRGGIKQKSTDTVFIRAGIETYSTNP